MKWFSNMKIGTKLLSSFILVALLAGLVGFIGIKVIKDTGTEYNQLYEQHGVILSYIGDIAVDYQQIRVCTRDIFVYKTQKEKNAAAAKIAELDKRLDESLVKCEKAAVSDEEKRLFAKLRAEIDKYNPVRDTIVNLVLANQEAQAIDLMQEGSEFRRLAQNVADTIDKMVDYNVTTGRAQASETRKHTDNIINVMLIIAILSVVVAILLGLYISRNIDRPINKLLVAAEQIAANNLNVTINVSSRDEIGALAGAFRKMAENINEVLLSINTSAEQVAAASRQVSDSSQALSQGATEQASSVEELSASMEEIASQTKLNAKNASEADELATKAKENAESGNTQMQEMLGAMEEINDSSTNISKIIKVIDEIAFQTNILALNAAVEAARAGEHGKGFAVVAEEVRNLAARSANAAKETTEMIEGSIKKVNDGRRIAKDTAAALNNIAEGVSKVASLVAGIASASNEQATGISQVNQGIMQVSQVTQTNSATAEQSAAASEELSSQADLLRSMVGHFKLKKISQAGFDRMDAAGMRNFDMPRSFTEHAEYPEKKSDSRPKISLDSRDFGKY